MTWKQVECPFERDRKILQYLLTVPVFSEDGEWPWGRAAHPHIPQPAVGARAGTAGLGLVRRQHEACLLSSSS